MSPPESGVSEERTEPVENKPLTFRLRTVPDHPFFAERQISPETVAHFGLGFCNKGMMADRIVIPINNERGELVAYCGRALTAEMVEAEKYKLPPGLNKMALVYNLDQQADGIKTLVVVESFLSVFRLYQAGIKEAVTCLGSSMSERQADLLSAKLGSAGQVLFLLDADEAGQKATTKGVELLAGRLFVKALDIAGLAKKPHMASEEELRDFLGPYF